MTTFQALLLGILQGLTEFLPVSSSGHLVLAESLFALRIPAESLQGFDILLHTGTLLALLVCFPLLWWRIVSSLWTGDRAHRFLLLLIIIATIPGAVAGLFFEDLIAEHLRSPLWLSVGFLVTAAVLWLGELRNGAEGKMAGIRPLHALIIGIAQACALPPGLSRSGLTISAGRWMGLSRREALDFSFLIAAPIIAGASTLTLVEFFRGDVILPATNIVATGFGSSFIASVGAILFLRRFVARMPLWWFSFYLVAVSVALFLGT